MDILDTLRSLLADQNMAVDPAWTDEMVSAYPYMALPAILELQRNSDMSPQRRSMLLQRAAVTAPLTETLHTIAEPDAIDPLNFYPPQPAPQSMTTEQVIDSFITRYGPADSGSEEAVLERLIFNPTPDYGSILEAEEENSLPDEAEATGDGQDALINAFILKSRRLPRHSSFPSPDDSIKPDRPEPQPVDHSAPPVTPPSERPDDSLLSESLAKIFIKRRQYQRAYEIISTLHLKYPQKSVYFADQLRFLQKLIVNQQYQNLKTTK